MQFLWRIKNELKGNNLESRHEINSEGHNTMRQICQIKLGMSGMDICMDDDGIRLLLLQVKMLDGRALGGPTTK
jgi:hypothetical protein